MAGALAIVLGIGAVAAVGGAVVAATSGGDSGDARDDLFDIKLPREPKQRESLSWDYITARFDAAQARSEVQREQSYADAKAKYREYTKYGYYTGVLAPFVPLANYLIGAFLDMEAAFNNLLSTKLNTPEQEARARQLVEDTLSLGFVPQPPIEGISDDWTSWSNVLQNDLTRAIQGLNQPVNGDFYYKNLWFELVRFARTHPDDTRVRDLVDLGLWPLTPNAGPTANGAFAIGTLMALARGVDAEKLRRSLWSWVRERMVDTPWMRTYDTRQWALNAVLARADQLARGA